MYKLKVRQELWNEIASFIVLNIIKLSKKNKDKFESMSSGVMMKIKVNILKLIFRRNF